MQFKPLAILFFFLFFLKKKNNQHFHHQHGLGHCLSALLWTIPTCYHFRFYFKCLWNKTCTFRLKCRILVCAGLKWHNISSPDPILHKDPQRPLIALLHPPEILSSLSQIQLCESPKWDLIWCVWQMVSVDAGAKNRAQRGETKFRMPNLQSIRKQKGRRNVSRFRWKVPKTRRKVPRLWYRDRKAVLVGKHRFRYPGKQDTGETHKSSTKVRRQGQRGEVKLTPTPQKKTLQIMRKKTDNADSDSVNARHLLV